MISTVVTVGLGGGSTVVVKFKDLTSIESSVFTNSMACAWPQNVVAVNNVSSSRFNFMVCFIG